MEMGISSMSASELRIWWRTALFDVSYVHLSVKFVKSNLRWESLSHAREITFKWSIICNLRQLHEYKWLDLLLIRIRFFFSKIGWYLIQLFRTTNMIYCIIGLLQDKIFTAQEINLEHVSKFLSCEIAILWIIKIKSYKKCSFGPMCFVKNMKNHLTIARLIFTKATQKFGTWEFCLSH